MKKFQVMMLMMLVAFMGLTVQSCGDDDEPDATQSYTLKVSLQDPGNLDPASAEIIRTQFATIAQTVRCTASQAKTALDQAMDEFAYSIPVADDGGNYLEYSVRFYLVDSSNTEVYSKTMVIKDGKRTVR